MTINTSPYTGQKFIILIIVEGHQDVHFSIEASTGHHTVRTLGGKHDIIKKAKIKEKGRIRLQIETGYIF